MDLRKHYSTVVLSDIHIGSEYSKIKEVTRFLKHVNCERLILNGDIIDGWQLHKSSRHWKAEHTNFFKVLMKMMEHCGTRIIYVRGNHDDFLDKLMPFNISNISIVPDYTFISAGKRYYVTHGDIFDTITTHMRWLAMLGDIGYSALLRLNKFYNLYRAWRGRPYYSLSQKVKQRVKSAVSYISDFRNELVMFAKKRKCDGIICGHIHQAANEYYEGVHYLNSGDWVESLTALVEDEQGNWSVVTYTEETFSKDFSGVAFMEEAI